MFVLKGSPEPDPTPESSSGVSGAQPPAPSPASPAGESLETPPPGGSGEWLQQYAWALEDNKLEDAAPLLKWLMARGEPWASAQAGELALERLTQLPDGKGLPAGLIRVYHSLGPLLPSSHAFHGVFLKRLEDHIAGLTPGGSALPVASAIDRALELFHSSLEPQAGFKPLREKLRDLETRSWAASQQEKERELEALLAAGEYTAALELCRELVDTYQSPLANGLMPALLAQAALLHSMAGNARPMPTGRRPREWDWPDQRAAGDDRLEGLYEPMRRAPPIPAEVEAVPPSTVWSRTFEAPPVALERADSRAEGSRDPGSSLSGRTGAATSPAHYALADDPFAIRRGQLPREPEALPDLRLQPEIDDTSGEVVPPSGAEVAAIAAAAAAASEAAIASSLPPPRARALGRWVGAAAVVALLTLLGWGIVERQRAPSAGEEDAARSAAQPAIDGAASEHADPAGGVPAQPASGAGLEASSAPTPVPVPAGPPASLTVDVTPPELLELYIDGQLQADGKVQNLSIPPGKHTLEVYREAHEKHQQEFVAAPGEDTRLQIALKRSPTITVEATPASHLEIALDGRRIGSESPLNRFVISPGKHELEVSSPGFQPYVEEFQVEVDEARKFAITLKPGGP